MTRTHATGGPLELTQADLLPLRPWRRAHEEPAHPSFAAGSTTLGRPSRHGTTSPP
ncbi:hypothetical protein M3696_13380 [Janibacter hoylei]|nr:hypothetical protein [Janibacter hoylei]MCT1620242.1 hypothetical protein [Janibacter hoylei]MCT2294136.1 hypothetical protein [Janibacter hoylei]